MSEFGRRSPDVQSDLRVTSDTSAGETRRAT
jgi:hypothetical protein